MSDLTIRLSGAVSIKRGNEPVEIVAVEIETQGRTDEAPGTAAEIGDALRATLEAMTESDECYG